MKASFAVLFSEIDEWFLCLNHIIFAVCNVYIFSLYFKNYTTMRVFFRWDQFIVLFSLHISPKELVPSSTVKQENAYFFRRPHLTLYVPTCSFDRHLWFVLNAFSTFDLRWDLFQLPIPTVLVPCVYSPADMLWQNVEHVASYCVGLCDMLLKFISPIFASARYKIWFAKSHHSAWGCWRMHKKFAHLSWQTVRQETQSKPWLVHHRDLKKF